MFLKVPFYPGCTEEDCLPIIEKLCGLKNINDFKLGYSPERINPGDKEHTLAKIIKVVSGCDAESLEVIAKVYELVVTAGVHRASCIKVAEAAKIIENTQRDLNIALMNELSIIFDRMNINTFEVLEAAGTKWNFLKFQPGLVGGHCIGVDPYYLTYKSRELGYDSQVILAGRVINDGMAGYVAKKVLQHIIQNNGNVKDAKVLVMGATFKENVSDIRNSKVADVVNELKSFSLNVEITDPLADSDELNHEYGFSLTQQLANDYDAVLVTVPHNEYKKFDDNFFAGINKASSTGCRFERDFPRQNKYTYLLESLVNDHFIVEISYEQGAFQIVAIPCYSWAVGTPPTADAPVGVHTNRRQFEMHPINIPIF